MTLLHELQDFGDLIAVTARDLKVDPGLVEKDCRIKAPSASPR